MRIHESAVAVEDIAAYGEELTDAELAEVSGGFDFSVEVWVEYDSHGELRTVHVKFGGGTGGGTGNS